ncbi:MAG: DUF3332 family protein [Nitrospira sp.]|nr:DUF3332 family protein [Nitrospira sp.]
MKSRRFHRKLVAAGVLACFLTATTACYGPFNLTKNVYHWNSGIKGSGEVSDKWMKEFVFFGMIVVPVYMFSALLDGFIFNSIQFWSGDNPVKATGLNNDGTTRVAVLGDRTIRWTQTDEGAIVAYERHGVVERRATILSHGTSYRLIDESGVVLAEAEYAADGVVNLLDRNCRVVQRWSIDQLRSIAESRDAILAEPATIERG